MSNVVARIVPLGTLVAVAILLRPQQSLAAFPAHTFDTDAQGWRIIGSSTDYGPPTTAPDAIVAWDTRGNPDGALAVGDNFYATWISAPAPFLGNQSSMVGQSFSYDIFIRYTDQTSVPYPSVAIESNGLKLLYTIATPPLNTWNRRVVMFDPALWTVGEGIGSPTPGPTATPAQLQSALSNLQGLYFLTEWRTGPDDTSVDNIGGTFATGLIGDYNHNNAVDAPDYVVWRKQLGSVYTATDYTIWRNHFGNPSGSGLSQMPVPEPSATLLLPLASIISIRRIGRRQ